MLELIYLYDNYSKTFHFIQSNIPAINIKKIAKTRLEGVICHS